MNKLKEINGKYYQEVEVVMLATDDKTAPILSYLNNKSLQYCSNTYWSNSDLSKRHLYFISNEKIDPHCKKIIATTDTSLSQIVDILDSSATKAEILLPQPSKEFIQAYIKAYNEGKPITKVLVEYWAHTEEDLQLKVNSSNEIAIKKVKDSYTKEETIELIKKFSNHFCPMNNHLEEDEDNWIEENL